MRHPEVRARFIYFARPAEPRAALQLFERTVKTDEEHVLALQEENKTAQPTPGLDDVLDDEVVSRRSERMNAAVKALEELLPLPGPRKLATVYPHLRQHSCEGQMVDRVVPERKRELLLQRRSQSRLACARRSVEEDDFPGHRCGTSQVRPDALLRAALCKGLLEKPPRLDGLGKETAAYKSNTEHKQADRHNGHPVIRASRRMKKTPYPGPHATKPDRHE